VGTEHSTQLDDKLADPAASSGQENPPSPQVLTPVAQSDVRRGAGHGNPGGIDRGNIVGYPAQVGFRHRHVFGQTALSQWNYRSYHRFTHAKSGHLLSRAFIGTGKIDANLTGKSIGCGYFRTTRKLLFYKQIAGRKPEKSEKNPRVIGVLV